MTDYPIPSTVEAYLAQLDRALAGVDSGTRTEIVDGVREELDGLDDATAAVRIEEFGDPEFIAAEARAASAAPSPTLTAPARLPATETAAYAIVASILIMVGGIVVPLVGWVVGIVMMWISGLWTARQKWIATLAPIAISLVVGVLVAIVGSLITSSSAPDGEGFNPLLPGPIDHLSLVIFFSGIVPIAVGIRLLVVALRRIRGRTEV